MKLWKRVKLAAFMAKAGWQGQGFDFSAWQGKNFWGVDNSQLATNENIFSVITRLSNTLATLPIKLYNKYEIVNNPASDVLLNEPNQNMSSFQLISLLEVSRNEKGNGYAMIIRDFRWQPTLIIPLDPSCVSPFINSDDGSLWYEVRGAKQTAYIHNLDMLHVKHIHGPSVWEGISPLKVLANTLRYDKAVQEFSLSEMEKKESFILKYGANLEADKRQAVINDFKRFYAENGGILLQEPGVEITEMKKQYFSTDTINSEKITRSRVANVFNVPVSFLNETGGGTFGSNEQEMIRFVQMTLSPIIRQYEQEFNRKLLSRANRADGLYFKFNLGGLLRGDTTTRTAYYQAAIRNGWLSQDEVRRLEDEPPVGGNAGKLWVSGDLYPIDMDPLERKGTKTTSEGGENSE